MSGPILLRLTSVFSSFVVCAVSLFDHLMEPLYVYVPPRTSRVVTSVIILCDEILMNIDGTMSVCCFAHLNANLILDFGIYCVTGDPICGLLT